MQEVENCGFVAWVDADWPETAQNALARLWGMYHECSDGRVGENIEHAKLLEAVQAEKKRFEKKYNDCVEEVNLFIKNSTKSCMKANYDRIQKEGRDTDMMQQLRITIDLLQKQIGELGDEMKQKQQNWDEEKAKLKEDKRKLEYSLYDLLKVKDAGRDKLKRIMAICEE